MNNPNLVDFNQWTTLIPGGYNGITLFNDQILVWENNNLVRRLEGTVLTTVVTASTNVIDVSVDSNNLTVTNSGQALVFNNNFEEITAIASASGDSFTLNTALSFSDNIYLGTNSRGLLEVNLNNLNNKTSITPEGPLLNSAFGVEAMNDNLWVVFGQYDVEFNPFPLQQRGISKLTSDGWFNISNDEVLGVTSLSHITINPDNEDQDFGVLKTLLHTVIVASENNKLFLYD